MELSKLGQLQRHRSPEPHTAVAVNWQAPQAVDQANLFSKVRSIHATQADYDAEDAEHAQGSGDDDDYYTMDGEDSPRRPLRASTLPSFAADKSEFVFAGILERSPSPTDFHITTIMLSHFFLRSGDIGYYFVKNDSRADWMHAFWQFGQNKYYPSGRRHHSSYSCHVHAGNHTKEIIVPAQFVPNRGTNVLGNNRRLDIMRCPVEMESVEDVVRHIEDRDHLQVVLYRGTTPIIRYHIPWAKRSAGVLVNAPRNASNFDPWQGFGEPATRHVSHVCVTCVKKAISRANVGLISEFISHHLSVGFDHITMSLPWAFNTRPNQHLLRLLSSYIQEGKLSIWSFAVEPAVSSELVPFEIRGMFFTKLLLTSLQSNLCLYLSKGMADYMLTSDIDEFFVPQINHGKDTMQVLIKQNEHQEDVNTEYMNKMAMKSWEPAPGWADTHRHPYCHLQISTEVFFPRMDHAAEGNLVGRVFAHGSEPTAFVKARAEVNSSLIPVNRIFYAGMRGPGACALPIQWTPCHSSASAVTSGMCFSSKGSLSDGPLGSTHSVDSRVLNEDARQVDSSQAVIYHFRYFDTLHFASPSAISRSNAYHDLWFPTVYADLVSRNLDLYLDLPALPTEETAHNGIRLMSPKEGNEFQFGDMESLHDDDLKKDEALVTEIAQTLTTSLDVVQLPRFSVDFSEYVFTSLIERAAASKTLTITTFLLCHRGITPKHQIDRQTILRIHPQAVQAWHKAAEQMTKSTYSVTGVREGDTSYKCRVTTAVHANGTMHPMSTVHVIEGRFVPNALSEDPNANFRYDLLRCPLPDSESLHRFAGRDVNIQVELLTNDQPVIKFHIPWRNRISGFMASNVLPLDQWAEGNQPSNDLSYSALSVQAQALQDVAYALPSTALNPWQDIMHKVYLCVPGWHSGIDRENLSHLLEFIQYHLQIGIQHIFLGVAFTWDSVYMQRLYRFLGRYISAGQLTVISHTSDRINFNFATGGTIFHFDAVKNLYCSLCVYYAKGMVEYVAIWDVDEFFVPQPPFKSIGDVLAVNNHSALAAKHSHLHCYIEVSSKTYFRLDPGVKAYNGVQLPLPPHVTADHETDCISNADRFANYALWIGHNYQQFTIRNDYLSHKKAIHLTDRAELIGLHTVGTCKLPISETDCFTDHSGRYKIVGDACYDTTPGSKAGTETHNYNSRLSKDDVLALNHAFGHIYHLQFFRNINTEVATDKSYNGNVTVSGVDGNTNFYAEQYGYKVWEELNRAGIFHPLVLVSQEAFSTPPNLVFYNSVYNNMSNYPAANASVDQSKGSKLLVSLPCQLGDTNYVVLSSTIVRHTHNVFNYALFAFLSNSTGTVDMADYDVFCDLQYGLSSYGIRGVYQAISEEVGYVRCMLSDSITESAGLDISVKLKFLPHTNSTAIRSIHFTIPAGVIGTGMGYPLVDNEIDLKAVSNEGYKLSIQQATHSRAALFQRTNSTAGLQLCVAAGFNDLVTRYTFAILLEFVEHHLQLGIEHIYLPVYNRDWASSETNSLMKVLKPFIQANRLTVWMIDRFNTVANNHSIVFKKSFLHRYSRMLCGIHGAHSSARSIAQWRIHQYLLPDDGQDISTLLQGQYRIRREQVHRSAFVRNHNDYSSQRRFWIGDILMADQHSVEAVSAGSAEFEEYFMGSVVKYEGIEALYSSSAMDAVSNPWHPPRPFDVLDGAVLADFYHLQHYHNYHIEPCNAYENIGQILRLDSRTGHPIDLHEEMWWRLNYHALCTERLHPTSGYMEDHHQQANASTSVTGGRYVEKYYPRVYGGLMEKNLDLFIDSIPLKEPDTMDTLNYVKYEKIFYSFQAK